MRLFADDADVAWVIGWVADDPVSDHDQGGAGYLRFVNGVEAFMHRQMREGADSRYRAAAACFRAITVLLSCGRRRVTGIALRGLTSSGCTAFPRHSVYGMRSSEYDDDGWRWPGDRNVASVQSIVDALEMNIEPRSSGDNGRKVLEMAIAIRESHRRGHCPPFFNECRTKNRVERLTLIR